MWVVILVVDYEGLNDRSCGRGVVSWGLRVILCILCGFGKGFF